MAVPALCALGIALSPSAARAQAGSGTPSVAGSPREGGGWSTSGASGSSTGAGGLVVPPVPPPPPPSSSAAVVTSVTPEAGATPAGAQRVLAVARRMTGQLRACHAMALRNDATLVGVARVAFQLNDQGRVVRCTPTESPSPSIGACFCGRVRSSIFPPPDPGTNPEYRLEVALRAGAPGVVLARPGCGRVIDADAMPVAVRALAALVLQHECLGGRGGVAFIRGRLEVLVDGGPESPGRFVTAAGGMDALRAAGVRSVRVVPTGGAAGEFGVLPAREQRVR